MQTFVRPGFFRTQMFAGSKWRFWMTLFGLFMGAATISADWLGSVPLVITAATMSSLLLYMTLIPESNVFRSYGMNRKRALAYKRRAAFAVWVVLCVPTLIVSPSLYGLLAIALVTGWLALYASNDATTGEELNSPERGSAIMGLRLDQPLTFQLFWKQPLLLAVAFGLGSVAVQFAVRSFADKTWIPFVATIPDLFLFGCFAAIYSWGTSSPTTARAYGIPRRTWGLHGLGAVVVSAGIYVALRSLPTLFDAHTLPSAPLLATFILVLTGLAMPLAWGRNQLLTFMAVMILWQFIRDPEPWKGALSVAGCALLLALVTLALYVSGRVNGAQKNPDMKL
ncbi:hypothetical protein KBX29_09870 [Corynebacterium sp. CCUG 18816]|uniref:hypothetical protein n=1 Tax=Corynebacterium pseudogenitalium TaxID=38303 RepID=UPI00210D9444|nr:hypothetical protein [Corynebacterium pseudogenitalium]MCQ4617130.1 hypothetical protein [Corynebacterium pseudogenitalium]